MRMRTMHSLGYALTQFDCPITFVAPPDMSLTAEFKQELNQYSLNFKEAEHVEQAIAEADVILVEPVVQPDYTKSRDERTGEPGPDPGQLQNYPRAAGDQGQAGRDLAALAAAHGRNSARCGYHPLVALLAGSLQRRGHAHGAAGAGIGRNGINLKFDVRRTVMQTFLHGRDLIGDLDFSKEEVETVLDVALDLKRKRALNEPHAYLRDKTLAMLFFFSSTRTRGSFEAGMAQLGGHAAFIESRTTQIAHGDTAKEIGEILGRYYDGMAIRHVDWGVGNQYHQ